MRNYRIVVVLDSIDPDGLSRFWVDALDYERSSSDEPYVVLVPRDRVHPELVLQRVPEPKSVKNRMHLDIRVSDLDEEVSRLRALGAARLSADTIEESGFRWVVMADPEGNEFCVCVEPAP
jgi:predicted enzyme related to lactoylglutathione lyase